MIPKARLAAVAAAFALVACASQSTEDMGAHMDEHFAAAVDVQTAVIRGDVQEAAEQAAWLSSHRAPDGLSSSSRVHVDAVRSAARDITRASSIDGAAEATGRMALACGSCHQDMEAGPGFLPGAPPPAGSSLRARMVRHIWAADRMWEGLVSFTDESWQAGSEVLTDALLSPRFVTEDTAAVERMNQIVDQVAGVATFARQDADWARRAELYGRLLPTCSGCHQIVGVDPLGLPGVDPLP